MTQYTRTRVRRYGGALLLAVTLMTTQFVVAPAVSHAITTGELVELLIALNIIPANKAADARQVASGAETTTQLPSTTGACPYSWTRDLTLGAVGPDVLALQRFLNETPATVVATAGAGAPGYETNYYGARTAAAVARYQNLHANAVLAPLGLAGGNGIFAGLTRAAANAACAAHTTPPPSETSTTTTPEEPTPAPRQVEASVWRYHVLNTPSAVDLEEGETKEVFGATFDVRDAPVTLARADVSVQAVDTIHEYKPWRMFDSLSLVYDGTVIGTEPADAESDWNKEGNNTYTIRFSNLATEIPKGTRAAVYVEATARNVIDSADTPQRFDVWFPDRGIRLYDGLAVNHYVGNDTMARDLTMIQAGATTELNVRLADNNPPASVVKVSANAPTSFLPLLRATFHATDGTVLVNSIPVTIYTYDKDGTTVPFDDVVADVRLVAGGRTLTDYTTTGTARIATAEGMTTATTLTFNAEDWTIVQGDAEPVTAEVRFVRQNNNFPEGEQVRVSFTHDNVAAIDAEDHRTIPADHLSGSASGELQTLRTEGVTPSSVTLQAKSTLPKDRSNSTAEFTVGFDLTAFGGTFYVPTGSARLAADGTTTISGSAASGAFFSVLNSSNATVASGTAASILTSNATKSGDAYVLYDGQTRHFTVQVSFDPVVAGFYRLRLDDVAWRSAGVANADATRQSLLPNQLYSTDFTYVQN